MLFLSPRHSVLAQVNLLKQLDCKTLLISAERSPEIDSILDGYDMRVFQIPELKDLLDQIHPYYEFKKTFDEAKNEPLIVLHTSGTTGFPKPVIWTHDWAASFAEERYLSPQAGYESMDGLMLGVRLLSLMPPFHVSDFSL